MAIYHCSTKPISRSSGRSATASIAYRAGVVIEDQRQGKTFDYSKRYGVLHAELLTPNNINISRSELWNLAETTETRKNSRTAREFVVNIPHELMKDSHDAGIALIREFSRHLKNDYGVAVDFAIHAPDQQGDNRNYHAHILLTTRQLERLESGRIALTGKSDLEQSNTQLKAQGKRSNQDELKHIREKWAIITNRHLEQSGINARIDHRSHKDRGLEELPTIKMGWQATELERKGIQTELGDQNRLIKQYNLNLQIKYSLESLERTQIAKEQHEAASKAEKQAEPPKPQKPRLERKTEPSSPIQEVSTDDKKKVVALFDHKVRILAQKIHTQKLETIKNKMDEYMDLSKKTLKEIENLRENKPFNPFKLKAWKQELADAINKHDNNIKAPYDNLKTDYQRIKNLGVTHEHWKKADAQMYQIDKNAYQKIKEFHTEINEKNSSIEIKKLLDQDNNKGR